MQHPLRPRPHRARRLAATLAPLVLAAGSLIGAAASVATAPAAVADDSISFTGGGYGHGVGMSQYGAWGMAKKGVAYADILKHYYAGISLGTMAQPDVRVGVSQVSSSQAVSMTTGGDVQAEVGGTTIASTNSGSTISVRVAANGQFTLTITESGTPRTVGPVGGGTAALRFHFAEGDGGHAGINGLLTVSPPGNRYRWGVLELVPAASASRIDAVFVLPMEKYLRGIAEMPRSWNAEALKAQAVASRSFAKSKIDAGQSRTTCSCQLLANTNDQVFSGYEVEGGASGSNWVAAVDGTSTVVATSGGKAINAVYSASSGGYTENSENVFGGTVSYLKGVPDPDDAAGGSNPQFSWTRTYSTTDLSRWMNAAGKGVGTVTAVQIVGPFGVSGRPVASASGAIKVVGTTSTQSMSVGTFRTAVNNGVTGDGGGLSKQLLSSLFSTAGFSPYGSTFAGGAYVAAGPLGGSGNPDRIVTGAESGAGPHVRTFTADGAAADGGGFFAYDTKFVGGVRVAVCTGAGGVQRIVTGPGPGGGPHIRVFAPDGTAVDGGGFFAYDTRFTGGVWVACGDLTGDGVDEIVTGAGSGAGPHLRVFTLAGQQIDSGGFFAYDPNFRAGVRPAVGRLSAGGPNLIFTVPGAGGGPNLRAFSFASGGTNKLLASIWADDPSYNGGLWIAVGDIEGDGADEVVTALGDSGPSRVRVRGANLNETRSPVVAFPGADDHGARLAIGRFPDARIVVASGPNAPTRVRTLT